ncbi:thioredoxin family protein [Celerinatantimonas yamalensis]|uniref:Thioredoxin family protein n=1 Tax=Celerinatantimonas yamalensis TaxID=559956 RepID=A0ABW9G7P5_9GAMM
MKLSRAKVNQWIWAMVGLLFAVAACGYIYIFHIRNYGVSAKDGWYFETQGYQQALSLSKQQNRPILFYFRAGSCQICKNFEKNILNNDDFITFTKPYLKVRYTVDLNRQQRNFARHYQIHMLPALIVQYQRNQAVSTHLVLPMQQVWVAKDSIQKGNHMPLSLTTMKLSLQRVTEIAHRHAMANKHP